MKASEVIHMMSQLQQDREGDPEILMITPEEMLIAELNKRGKLIVTVVPIPQREREYRERKTKKRKPGRFLG
jgi:hypothetical protein